MAITKVSRGLLSTGISDSSDATAITITSGEKVEVKTGFTMQSSVAANNTGDFKIIESANSTAGVGYAAPIIGANIDDAVNGSNVPTQDNVWSGVSGASALSLSADMSADNATHMFWGSGPSESAGTALTKLLSVSRNGGVSFGTDTCNDDNTLDDYEEGSFDAHIRNAANDAVLVTATNDGKYIKIGRFVFVTIQIYENSVSSTTLSSSYNYIQMPFTSASNFNATGFYPMYYGGVGNIKAGYISSNTTKMYLCTNRDIPLTNLAGTEVVGGSVRLYGDLVYMAAT